MMNLNIVALSLVVLTFAVLLCLSLNVWIWSRLPADEPFFAEHAITWQTFGMYIGKTYKSIAESPIYLVGRTIVGSSLELAVSGIDGDAPAPDVLVLGGNAPIDNDNLQVSVNGAKLTGGKPRKSTVNKAYNGGTTFYYIIFVTKPLQLKVGDVITVAGSAVDAVSGYTYEGKRGIAYAISNRDVLNRNVYADFISSPSYVGAYKTLSDSSSSSSSSNSAGTGKYSIPAGVVYKYHQPNIGLNETLKFVSKSSWWHQTYAGFSTNAPDSPQAPIFLAPVDPKANTPSYDAIMQNVAKVYDEIRPSQTLPTDPTSLPVVDLYKSQRDPNIKVAQITNGRWWVAFKGPTKWYLDNCSVRDPSKGASYQTFIENDYLSDAKLKERLRLLDKATDVFLRTMKIDLYYDPSSAHARNRAKLAHKLVMYFTGTGLGVPKDQCGGSPDWPFGFIGSPDGNWGTVLHELGHAMFPAVKWADLNNAMNDNYDPSPNRGRLSPVMCGEIAGNFFGWYVSLLMMTLEPDHPYWQDPFENSSILSFIVPIQRMGHFFVNSHLAFDSSWYTTFASAELNKGAKAVHEADVQWHKDHVNTDVKAKFIAKLESIYGGRYSNVALVIVLYRKWGIKAMVGFYYHFFKEQDALKAITKVLGVDGPTFLCQHVIDVVTQTYYEGNDVWIKELADGKIVKLKEPFPYALPWTDTNDLKRQSAYPMEYKGYDLYELRKYVKQKQNKEIRRGDSVVVTWSMADKAKWRMVTYNGYGRNGWYKINETDCVFMPMDAGKEQTVPGSAGTLTIGDVVDGPVFFALIAAEPGVATAAHPAFEVRVN